MSKNKNKKNKKKTQILISRFSLKVYHIWETLDPHYSFTNRLALNSGSNLGEDCTSSCPPPPCFLLDMEKPAQIPSHMYCCFSHGEEERKMIFESMDNTVGKWKIAYNIYISIVCNIYRYRYRYRYIDIDTDIDTDIYF